MTGCMKGLCAVKGLSGRCLSAAKAFCGLGLCLAAGLARGEETVLWAKGDFAGAEGTRVEKSAAGDELVLPRPGAHLSRSFALKPEWRVLRLKGEMKATGVPRGEHEWQTARFAMDWRDAAGKTIAPWPRNHGWTGTTGWKAVDCTYLLPTNAVRFNLSLCNLAPGGEVRFRNVSFAVARTYISEPANAPLPEGAPADAESLDGAWRETTPTRTRLSLNGLWRIRPAFADDPAGRVPGPSDCWAWDRVPAVWPEPSDGAFMASRALAPYFEDHPGRLAKILPQRAWYARTLTFPPAAKGQRTAVTFDMVASRAVVYVDGRRAGEAAFPGGEVDVSALVKPGARQTLAIDVTAYAEGETLDYNESSRKERRAKTVKNKGLTGDVWLDLLPKGARVADAWAETSVSRGEITFVAETEGLAAKSACRVQAEVFDRAGRLAKTFRGEATPDAEGRLSFAAPWKDAALWDVHTPENLYACRLSVFDGSRLVDAALPFAFGFREVRVKGRDLYLNGTKIHLRALYDGTFPHDSATAAKPNARAYCRALQKSGFNFLIAGNYSFEAGAAGYMQGMLEACDETGMLYSFTLPHFKDFDDLREPENQARYRALTRALMRHARRHPSVVTWATSHNAAGSLASGNPRLIDGVYELPDWVNRTNRARARIARKVIGELDATRPCYHHESGNLDDFHTVNCYQNWAPVQERSDWLEHWATKGVKPLFFVEYGLPHISSWASYRGPLFIWSGTGYMSLWSAEYAAAYRNDAAYEATPEMRRALAEEERLWASGKPFHWGRLTSHCFAVTNNYLGVQARFAHDNWRSFRGWGITAMLPWDQGGLFDRTNATASVRPKDYYAKTPGLKMPLYVPWGDPRDYAPSQLGKALLRWNLPECAWIAGDGTFTDKRHAFRPGETVRKTLMVLNDRRVAQTVTWKVACGAFARRGKVVVPPGEQARVPVAFAAPQEPGAHELRAAFGFTDGKRRTVRSDAFALTVVSAAPAPEGRLAVYDPKGMTLANLRRLGFAPEEVKDVLAFDASRANAKTRLVVGRECLTREILEKALVPFAGNGGRIFVFEQTKPALEAVGFRVQTLGLRHVYPRFRKEGLAAVQDESRLRDWAGASTLVEPFDSLESCGTGAGSDTWAGFRNSRVWRCGNRGAVATVVPEKPSFGDWCALADGGFDLQYAPLLEWRLGDGTVTFCQMDVTGRTVDDPAADELVKALVADARTPLPGTRRALPLGLQAYRTGGQSRSPWMLEHDRSKDSKLLYYVTDGAADMPADFHENVRSGATALLCGLSAEEVAKWSPVPLAVAQTNGCYYSRVESLPPELNGLSNADWAWHGAMDFAAFTDAAADGNNAIRVVRHGKGRLVFWQVPPWRIDDERRPYLRTSKRRAEAMLSRLMGNLGFLRGPGRVLYADIPCASDDPYRYYHW